MAPPGTWYIAIDRDSSPSIQLTVIDMQIVESHILDHRKYAIVPACIDHQLVFEKGCRVLGSCNWPTAFSLDSSGQQFAFRLVLAFVLACFLVNSLLVGLVVRTYPVEVISGRVLVIDASEQIHTLFGGRQHGFLDKFTQWCSPNESGHVFLVHKSWLNDWCQSVILAAMLEST